ncbi:Membrane protein involved in the export of O-antigen and teichoic acid (RfbX) [Commensalibacter communis]|uniref:lipopolysaccharide biosynthesis protein n=1 Tax=Commensalibacter communis TaxID=2972786 RepID=UPI0022FF5EAE|nr:lipopolysaccharide biosynthesis protein [Commensalibacter communis]CAI3959408.1 Membrane protein involved in the export of O-antigen and teichoic acid (RfbX) [Commensalibacter communis]
MNLLHNVKWLALSQVVKVACQLLGLVIFARYLTPKDIGVMSLTMIVVSFVNILRDMGSSAAIIQKEEIDDTLISSVFILNTIMGFSLAIIFYFLSYYISHFFQLELLQYTIKLISITFILNSITSVHLAILERKSKFRTIALTEVISSICALTMGVYFATHDYGVYSLVFQTLSFSLLTSISFCFFSGWKVKFIFDIDKIKSIFKFSSNLVLFNFVNYFSRNSDEMIIGKFFTASILGEYSLAYRVMLFPVQNMRSILTRSLYPILSRLQTSSNEAVEVYLKSIKAIAMIVPPVMLCLSTVSHEFTLLVFGSQWLLLPKLLVWLSVVGILQAIVSTTGAVFMSKGKTDLLLYISIFNSVLQVGSFIIGGFYNIEVLVKLYLLANVIMFFPNTMLAVRLLGGRFSDFMLCIYKPMLCAVLMFFLVKLIGLYFVYFNISLIEIFIIKILLSFVIYISLLLLTNPNVYYVVKNKIMLTLGN